MLSRISLVLENEVQIELPGRVLVLTDPKGSSVGLMACELVATTKTLDVRCCLVWLVKYVPVEGLDTVMTEALVDDLSCMVTDTPFAVVVLVVAEISLLDVGNEVALENSS